MGKLNMVTSLNELKWVVLTAYKSPDYENDYIMQKLKSNSKISKLKIITNIQNVAINNIPEAPKKIPLRENP